MWSTIYEYMHIVFHSIFRLYLIYCDYINIQVRCWIVYKYLFTKLFSLFFSILYIFGSIISRIRFIACIL